MCVWDREREEREGAERLRWRYLLDLVYRNFRFKKARLFEATERETDRDRERARKFYIVLYKVICIILYILECVRGKGLDAVLRGLRPQTSQWTVGWGDGRDEAATRTVYMENGMPGWTSFKGSRDRKLTLTLVIESRPGTRRLQSLYP